MFHSLSIDKKINLLHERVLRIVYNDFKSSFKNLLEKDGTVSIHVKNLQKLATEMFKISKNFSVPLMSELFYQKVNHYDLRNPYEFSIPNVNSVFHGQASIRYLGPPIWQLAPSEFKDLNTVSAFKAAIREWKLNNCPCRLCSIKDYTLQSLSSYFPPLLLSTNKLLYFFKMVSCKHLHLNFGLKNITGNKKTSRPKSLCSPLRSDRLKATLKDFERKLEKLLELHS